MGCWVGMKWPRDQCKMSAGERLVLQKKFCANYILYSWNECTCHEHHGSADPAGPDQVMLCLQSSRDEGYGEDVICKWPEKV